MTSINPSLPYLKPGNLNNGTIHKGGEQGAPDDMKNYPIYDEINNKDRNDGEPIINPPEYDRKPI